MAIDVYCLICHQHGCMRAHDLREAATVVDLARVQKGANCGRLCALSSEFLLTRLATRFNHNGVSYSHSFDLDEVFRRMLPDGDVERILVLWCQEHHAGRDGHEIQITVDGQTGVLSIPEAVN